MTKCRKALSLLLTILMVFSLFPMMVSADETGTGSTKPVWPEEGSIKLDKNANAVEGAKNLWEIVLSIQGKNYKTTSDVVLVIDCSGSMKGSNFSQKTAQQGLPLLHMLIQQLLIIMVISIRQMS